MLLVNATSVRVSQAVFCVRLSVAPSVHPSGHPSASQLCPEAEANNWKQLAMPLCSCNCSCCCCWPAPSARQARKEIKNTNPQTGPATCDTGNRHTHAQTFTHRHTYTREQPVFFVSCSDRATLSLQLVAPLVTG